MKYFITHNLFLSRITVLDYKVSYVLKMVICNLSALKESKKTVISLSICPRAKKRKK